MPPLYTLGHWTVQTGREDEFVAAWHDLAEWTVANVSGSAWAKLLRDRDDPQRFISFGPWRDEGSVAAWRQHPGFQERVGAIRALVEDFTPHTMTLAAEIGAATPDP